MSWPPSSFTESASAVLVQDARVRDGLLHRDVVRHEGHVADDVGTLHAAHDGLGVDEHLVHRDGHGVLVAQLDHAEAVADQDDVDARLVDDQALGVRVGGDHRDLLPLALHCQQVDHEQLLDVAHVQRSPSVTVLSYCTRNRGTARRPARGGRRVDRQGAVRYGDPMQPGPRNSITDVPGITVGQAQNARAARGCTVIFVDRGTACGVDVRGGSPGTRETDCLAPTAAMTCRPRVSPDRGQRFRPGCGRRRPEVPRGERHRV